MAIKQIQITDEAVAKYKNASIDDALLQAIFNGIDAYATEVEVRALSHTGDLMAGIETRPLPWAGRA